MSIITTPNFEPAKLTVKLPVSMNVSIDSEITQAKHNQPKACKFINLKSQNQRNSAIKPNPKTLKIVDFGALPGIEFQNDKFLDTIQQEYMAMTVKNSEWKESMAEMSQRMPFTPPMKDANKYRLKTILLDPPKPESKNDSDKRFKLSQRLMTVSDLILNLNLT